MKKTIDAILYRYILPYGGLFLVKALSSTNRLRIVDAENEKCVFDRGESVIYASWHQRFFPGITFFSTRKPIAIMISQSRDGAFISHIVDILGWKPVRGSSSKRGAEALRELADLAGKKFRIGHIVDGPRGPSGVVKPGLIRIAQVAGLPILPTITSAEKKWTFNSWDRFMIPKPFSKVIVRFGKAIYISSELGEDEFEEKRRFVERKIRELYEDTDRIWKDREKVKQIFP